MKMVTEQEILVGQQVSNFFKNDLRLLGAPLNDKELAEIISRWRPPKV